MREADRGAGPTRAPRRARGRSRGRPRDPRRRRDDGRGARGGGRRPRRRDARPRAGGDDRSARPLLLRGRGPAPGGRAGARRDPGVRAPRPRARRPVARGPRPGRSASAADRSADGRPRGRDRPLRIGGRAGSDRGRPDPRAGTAGGARRAQRRGQDHRHESPPSLSRPRRGHASRSPAATPATTGRRTSAATVRPRRPGRAPVRLHHPREPPAGAPGRDRRRSSAMCSTACGWASGSRRSPPAWTRSVGEEGTELSGGQRQRLVLARALLADAPSSSWTSPRRISTRRPPRRS